MTSLIHLPIMRQLNVSLSRALRLLGRRPVVLAALALTLFATACGDRVVTGPSASSQIIAPVSLDVDINAIIDAAFPNGLRTAAHARWDDLKRQLVRTPKGPSQASKQQYLNLVAWIRQQTSKLSPPGGETAANAASRLVLDISLYIYNGADYQPPIVAPTADVTLAVVSPSEPSTVVTPTEHAGVAFPAGAVSEQTVVVVAQETRSYPDNCSGPLETRYCQYPQFYTFNVFPDVHLNSPAQIAVCHINSGTNRGPLPGSDHDEYRVAHDLPADPANYTTGATQIDGIEILPYKSTGTLVDCDNTGYAVGDQTGGGFQGRTRLALARFGGFIGRVLTPKKAYAIDQGGGGMTEYFSHVAVVDPHSKPDFAPGGAFTLSTTNTTPGNSVTIQPWSVENSGTAASKYSTLAVLATDSLLTNDTQNLTTAVTSQNALSPQQAGAAIAAQAVTIPATLQSGTYFVGVRIIPSGPLADRNPANNVVSVRVQVTAPVATLTLAPQAATIFQAATVSLTPTLKDANNYVLTGRVVTWSSSAPSIATVNATGVVTGVSPGVALVTATSEGQTASAQITVTQPPLASMTVTTAPPATVRNRIVFPTQPTVVVRDATGATVPGVAVTVSLTSGGGTLNGTTTATTNAAGVASFTNLSIAGLTGPRTVTFSTATGLTVAATTTLAAGLPTAVAASAGNNQMALVGTTLPVAPAVTVSDADGNGVGGLTVNFAVTGAGGSVDGTPATTDASGVAAATSWTLGTQAGRNILTATVFSPAGTSIGFVGSTSGTLTALTISGSPAVFYATGTPGPAAKLGFITTPAGLAFTSGVTIPVRVAVQDAFGNTVPSATGNVVTVAIGNNPGGGTLSGTTTVSTVNGVADFNNLSINKAGVGYTLTATSSGFGVLTSGTFNILAGPPAILAINAGNNQVASAGTFVSIPPSVRVTDAAGNPIVNVQVFFNVTGGGGTITGAGPFTNASGIATLGSWKLGTTPGTNTLSAIRGGLSGSPLTFTATGTSPNP